VKRLWQQYMTRMEAASLRERVLVFAAAAAVLIGLLNAALIEPEFGKQRRLSLTIAKQQGELSTMQTQLQKLALAREADPDQAARNQLKALRTRISDLEGQLNLEQRKFAPPERIGALLEEMLSRNRKLQLVDMRTLPHVALGGPSATEQPAAAPKPGAAKPGAVATPAGPARGPIYRHGVEITVSGSYLDLLAYLRDLEKLPNQMYWGKLDLSVTAHPQVTLKLSVYTLSFDLAWLVV